MKQACIERTKNGSRYDKAAVYGFRKRFNTILKLNNDVNSNVAEKLMAHKRGLDGAYLQPTREQCFAEFQKAIEQLTIDPTQRQQQQIRGLEQEKSELEKLREEIKNNKESIEEFKNEIEEIMKGELIPSIYHRDPVIREGKPALVPKKLLKFIGNPFTRNCEKCIKRDENRVERQLLYNLELPSLKRPTLKQMNEIITRIRAATSDLRQKDEFANAPDSEIITLFLRLMDSYKPRLIQN